MPINAHVWLVRIASLMMLLCTSAHAQATRSFSLADDIGMSRIVLQNNIGYGPVTFSPDGRNFAAITERGLVDRNLVEGTIWIWRVDEILRFVRHREQLSPPSATQLVRMATFKKGPIISALRWLNDSSGIVFLAVSNSGSAQVLEVDLSTKVLRVLTPEDQDVVGFDFRNGNLAYTVKSPERVSDTHPKRPAFVTGESLTDLLFPLDRYPERGRDQFTKCDLWAVIDGKRFRVENTQTHEPIQLYQLSLSYVPDGVFALSPDGRSLAAYNAVDTVPKGWSEYRTKPGVPASAFGAFTAGKQDLHRLYDYGYVNTYFTVNLLTGDLTLLASTPEGTFRGWYDFRAPRWSPDGQGILLPNLFLPLDTSDAGERSERQQHPCASVLNLPTQKLDCLVPLKSEAEGAEEIRNVSFDRSDSEKIIFQYDSKSVIFRKSGDGSWKRVDPQEAQGNGIESTIDVNIRQSLNEPPVLMARDRTTNETRPFWDPNPQFQNINLGDVSVFHWKDRQRHEWEAGLVKPPNFVSGKRYPLVIQTHGFWKDYFLTYGPVPTAFAARELAAAGMIVLQMPDDLNGVVSTPREAARHVAGFESAVEKLAADGLVDPHRVGLVGFSRTCYYVMQALTASKLHFAAADITDGITYGYWQYMARVDHGGPDDADSLIGTQPFRSGMKLWLARSPEFNLDKVETPLLIVGQGAETIFWQWEEYSGLRYLKKPVELLDLGGDNYEHVLTNPQKRLASQGSTVDWFRFWLKGEEDPDPAKAGQYADWDELRRLQQRNLLHSGRSE